MIALNGIRWSLYEGALLPDAPPHRELSLSVADQRYLLRQSGAYFVRWTSHWDCLPPTEFWHVIKDRPSGLEDYLSNTRRYTKRGLRLFTVEKVEGRSVAEAAYEVYLKAFARYASPCKPETRKEFTQGLREMGPDTDVWVVSKAGEMVGYAINQVREDMCEYAAMKFDPDYLKEASAFALIHTMNGYYLEQLGLKYITDGTRSLYHATNMQEFLSEHFGFRKAFCRLHIAYAPGTWLAMRVLFPLRRQIYRGGRNWLQRLSVLLKHEEIRRSFEESQPCAQGVSA